MYSKSIGFFKKYKIEIALIVITLIVVSSYGINTFPILKDHGLYSYSGQEVLEGKSPYTTAVKMKGPMDFFIQAFFMGIFFFLPNYLAVRIGMLILIVIFIVVYYRIIRRISGDNTLSLASSLIIIGFIFFMELFLLGGPKPLALLFILLSLNTLFKKQYLLSALFISFSFLTYQPTGLIFLVLLVFVYLKRKKLMKNILSILTGFSIPIIGILSYFWFIKSLNDFIEISFFLPIEIRSVNTFINTASIFNTFGYYCTEILFIILAFFGFVYILYLFVKEIQSSGFEFFRNRKEIFTFSLAFILMAIYIIRDYQTGGDLIFLLPVISVVAAFSLKNIFKYIVEKFSWSNKIIGISLLILIGLYGFFPALQPVYPENPVIRDGKEMKRSGLNVNKIPSEIIEKYGYVNSISTVLFQRKGEEILLDHQLKIANYIKNRTDKNEKLLSFSAPELLFLADRENLNRYPHLAIRSLDKKALMKHTHTHHILKTSSFKNIREEIISSKPKFIITQYNVDRTIDNIGLRSYVDKNYIERKIIDPKEYKIYELK